MLQIITFWLIYVTVKMSSCGANADMETSAWLVNAITDNAVFHSSSHINQMLPQIVHILLDMLPQIL